MWEKGVAPVARHALTDLRPHRVDRRPERRRGVSAVRTWFVPASAATIGSAALTVQTQPDSAVVLIDDEPRGKTPLTIRVAAGSHRMAIRAAGVERTVQLNVVAGAQLSQYFDLSGGSADPDGCPSKPIRPARALPSTDRRVVSRRSSSTILPRPNIWSAWPPRPVLPSGQ